MEYNHQIAKNVPKLATPRKPWHILCYMCKFLGVLCPKSGGQYTADFTHVLTFHVGLAALRVDFMILNNGLSGSARLSTVS